MDQKPANLILVHGEEKGMDRLKAELEKQFLPIPKNERPLVFNPKNCAEVSWGGGVVLYWEGGGGVERSLKP